MSRADSPLEGRMIFAFGARRSGTYWLHRILAAHPDVDAVPSETHLFSHGIAPLMEIFHQGARDSPRTGGMYVDREELLDAVRDLCDRVLAGHLEDEERFLVERTPLHVLYAGLIGEIYPDAHLVHIVRDGRDVARSLLVRPWGPAIVSDAAREWRSAVRAARAARSHPGYLEVRYEEILANPRHEIGELYGAIGLECSPAVVESAVQEAAVPANIGPGTAHLAAERWRRELSAEQVAEVEAVARDDLAELGYELATQPPSPAGRAGRGLGRPGPTRRGEARLSPGPPWRENPEQAARTLERLLAIARDDRPQAAAELLLMLDEKKDLRVGAGERRRPQPLTAWFRRAARRLGARRGRERDGDRGGLPGESDARLAVRLADELLTFAHQGDAEAAANLLSPRALVTIVNDGRRLEGRGERAREILIQSLNRDPALRGRQLRGEVIAGERTAAYVLTYDCGEGRATRRLLLLTAREGCIRQLALHRFDDLA